jgi:hypothetical protein
LNVHGLLMGDLAAIGFYFSAFFNVSRWVFQRL